VQALLEEQHAARQEHETLERQAQALGDRLAKEQGGAPSADQAEWREMSEKVAVA
jgi:hypothetical protein